MKETQKENFDLIILDIHMPETDSLSLIENLLSINANTKILILSANPENMFAMRYLKAGCYGYISKTASNDEFRKAIKTIVLSNSKYLSQFVITEISENIVSHKKEVMNPFTLLANREMDVVMMLLRGMQINDISQTINVHKSTVATYKTRAFEKLNVKNVIELKNLADLHNLKA